MARSQIVGWVLLSLIGVGLFFSIKSMFGEVAKEDIKKTSNIGDIVKVGPFEYKINNYELRNRNDLEDRKDLIVSIDISNSSNKSEKTDLKNFILKIEENTFETDLLRGASANGGSSPFSHTQLNPEQKIQGYIVFDISNEQSEAEELNLIIKESSYAPNEETIKLK